MQKNIILFVSLFLVGCILSGGIALSVNQIQTEKVQSDYQHKIEKLAEKIQQEFNLKLEVLYAFLMLHTSSNHLSAAEFSKVSKYVLARHADIKAIEWAPYIEQNQRKTFELNAKKIHPDFKITAKTNQRELVLADIKPFYVPVLYVEPLHNNEAAVGFDLASHPARLATLVAAEKMGKALASAPIKLVQAENDGLGMLITLPVFNKLKNEQPYNQHNNQNNELHNNQGTIKGYLLLVLQLNSLFEQALPAGLFGHHKIQLRDITDTAEPAVLLSEIVFPSIPVDEFSVDVLMSDIAGRNWQIVGTPSDEYINEQLGNTAWLVFIVGFLFTLLSAWFVFYINNSARRMRLEVAKRTKELNSSKTFLEEITNSVPILLAYVDHKLTYQFMNQNYERWYKKPKGSVIGQSIYAGVGDEVIATLKMNVQKTMSGEVSRFNTVNLSHNRLGPKHTRTSLTPNFNHKGEVSGFYMVVEDITTQKNSEDKLQEHALELEFQTWALEESKDKAEAATRIKSEFLANMSHEIRTPMNGVLGMLSLLKKSELNSNQSRYVDLAESSASTLLTLINDILDFSKVEAGKLLLENKGFNLVELITDFAELTEVKVQEKGLFFSLVLTNSVPEHVIGDEVRLTQILTNLTSNAIKFTSEGEIKIVINLIETTEQHHRLQIEVHDTGIGIAEDKIDHLFDAFQQEDSSTTREFGGTGLGLAISKNLVELMNGHIVVSSIKGEGTCFTAELCLGIAEHNILAQLTKDAEADLDTSTIPLESVEDVEQIELPHILLVEDNYVNQVVATEMLKPLGFTIDIAENGLIAIQMLEKQPADYYRLILMDCLMPEMDGYAATRNIRINSKIKNGYEIPIIAMTANAMKGDKEQCIDAGMSDYISKPIDPAVLSSMLEKWLK